MSISDLRREYNLAGLRRTDLEPDPLAQFNKWFEQARGVRFVMPPTEREGEGITLAIAVDPDGLPLSFAQHRAKP